MKNSNGVDVDYIKKNLERVLRDLSSYPKDELARKLAQISMTVDDSVILTEEEFNKKLN